MRQNGGMTQFEREVCLCFHVTLGKLWKHCRLHEPTHATQLSDCHGAGTGCGWCVPFLERLHEQYRSGGEPCIEMTEAEYTRRRLEYHRSKRTDLPEPQPMEGLTVEELLEAVPEDLRLDSPKRSTDD